MKRSEGGEERKHVKDSEWKSLPSKKEQQVKRPCGRAKVVPGTAQSLVWLEQGGQGEGDGRPGQRGDEYAGHDDVREFLTGVT